MRLMVHVRQWLLEPVGPEPEFEQQRGTLKGEPMGGRFFFWSVFVLDKYWQTIAISAIF